MLTSYAAYLIRCWRDRSGLNRVEIVHVQSGERSLAHSTAEALAWIEGHGTPGTRSDSDPVGDSQEEAG
ncbi:MAG TPA: hypothetical protein VFA78_09050 [Chloroflexota bacterium]|nr:hypothetical protein [Chloroflexota bacterium]